jgi:hypothetical protein
MTDLRRILSAQVETLSRADLALRSRCLNLVAAENESSPSGKGTPTKAKPADYIDPTPRLVETIFTRYKLKEVISEEMALDGFERFVREAPVRNIHHNRTNAFEAIPIAPRSEHRAPAPIEAKPLVEQYLANGGEVHVHIPGVDAVLKRMAGQERKLAVIHQALAELKAEPAPQPISRKPVACDLAAVLASFQAAKAKRG